MNTKVAVRKLRKTVGDTQQEFAARMGWGIATVVRYEHNRIPTGPALVQLAVAAKAAREPKLAGVFVSALCSNLGASQALLKGVL